MAHSLLGADRLTHLKILAVALVAGVVFDQAGCPRASWTYSSTVFVLAWVGVQWITLELTGTHPGGSWLYWYV